jgi:regulator of cell morphogenesis and NO signaling
MLEITLQSPVGDLAAQRPAALPILERLGVDYCCGGKQTLEKACRQANIDPRDVLAELDQAQASAEASAAEAVDWTTAPLAALCDHIERTHHAFLREQLPFLSELIEKVVAAHGAVHPELAKVREMFRALRGELEPHMFKEERILFPAIRMLEASASAPSFPFGTVNNPIGVMEHEHDVAGEALHKLRELTGDYNVPEDACNAYRGLLESLQRLESDLHLHIHKENNILFPRSAELERCRKSS